LTEKYAKNVSNLKKIFQNQDQPEVIMKCNLILSAIISIWKVIYVI